MRRLAILIVLCTLLPAAAAGAATTRVSVAVVGDSIVESSHLAAPERDGFTAQLRAELARRGVDAGAAGFVSAHPGEPVRVLTPQAGRGSWSYLGAWAWITRWPGAVADLFSWTSQPQASASMTASGADSATLVYVSGPGQGQFAFRAGAASVEVDGHAERSGLGLKTLALPGAGEQRLQVSDVRQGGLALVGAFLRRTPRPGARQVELTAIARGGALAADPPTVVEDAGLAVLRPRATLIVMGTNDGIGYAATRDPAALDALRAGLETRARRARRSGACLVVPPGRDKFPADVYALVRSTVADAARATGCTLVPALNALDADPALTVDGIHPSPAGYARLARLLAPRLLTAAARRR